MTLFDVAAVRSRFPSLQQSHNGVPPVFFDNPAGTQVPQAVIDAVSDYFLRMNANAGGAFATSIANGARVGGAVSERAKCA
jgi:selenocysteine lyase/cysteine desulfurase